MSTRAGTQYHPSQSDPEPNMDNDHGRMLRAITEQLARMTDQLDQLGGRVQSLEESRSNPTEPESPHHRQHHHDPGQQSDFDAPHPTPPPARRPYQYDHGPIPRRPQYPDPAYHPREPYYRDQDRRPNLDHENPDDRAVRNVKLDAPTFDSSLDPKIYEDWEGDMDQYFDWYDMSEVRKYKFAKTRLVHQARLYWGNLELLIRRRGAEPIATWAEMKRRLRDKYVPMSYHQKLLDQWQRLNQGNKPVSEYIAKFDEFVMRCHLAEPEEATLSRFRAGLREDIQRELYFREVNDLELAYQIARTAERFHRGPISSRPTAPPPRPVSGPNYPSRPTPSPVTARPEDKGKAPETPRPSTSRAACFRCHKVGHFASNCPSRSLHIGESSEGDLEPCEEYEEEVYEADPSLIEAYEEEDAPIESDLVGVVRCILSQAVVQEDWHRTNILQIFFKLGDKVCKVIIDSGSCVNAISTSAVKSFGLTSIPHPNPYKVSWIDSTSIPIKSRCKVPIKLQSYQEDVWCDVVPMGVSSVILGRPWLFDHDATLFGKTNSCSFTHLGKKTVIHPTPPRDSTKKASSSLKEKKPGLNLITDKELEQEIK